MLQANHYYKLFIGWMNERMRRSFVARNQFEFAHIRVLERTNVNAVVENAGSAAVVFATPGMLHAGQSLHIFRRWAPNERNMVRTCTVEIWIPSCSSTTRTLILSSVLYCAALYM